MTRQGSREAATADTSVPAPERLLLERLRAGDETAFEDIVRQHSGRMLSVARRILRRDQDAQDAVQDAWLCAFRALPSFREGCQLATWLHRIVVNASLMRVRSRRRAPEQSIEPLLPVFLANGQHAQAVHQWNTAEQLMMSADTRAAVRRAIDQLPERYRLVLILRDLEEMATEEVAATLGITANAVKIRAHRARQALITLLEPVFGRSRESAMQQATRPRRDGGRTLEEFLAISSKGLQPIGTPDVALAASL